MLVIEYNQKDCIVKMINVSSLRGKEHKLLYASNIEIENYTPLPKPSFAKVNTLYTIDYFTDLENYVVFNGKTLIHSQFQNIDSYRLNYMKSKEIEMIQYTEKEFRKYNT